MKGTAGKLLALLVVACAGALAIASLSNGDPAPYTITTPASVSVLAGRIVELNGVTVQDTGTPLANPVDVCLFDGSDGTNVPDGISALNSPSVFGDGNAGNFPIEVADGVAPGDYSLTLGSCAANAADNVFSAPFTLHVLTPPPDYQVRLGHNVDELFSGESIGVDTTVVPSGGFSSEVDLCLFGPSSDIASLPAGITLDGGQNHPFPSTNYEQTLQIDTAADTAPGAYQLYISPCADASKAQGFEVIVDTPSFEFSPDSPSYKVFSGQPANVTALVGFDPGFAGPVTFSLSGAPTGITAGAFHTATQSSDVSLPINVDPSVPTGDYTFDIVGSASGVSPVSEQIEIAVVQPSADGTGTVTLDQGWAVANGDAGKLDFHYHAVGGGLYHGSVKIDMPNGWGDPTNVTSSDGTVSTNGASLTVSNVTLLGGEAVDITVGDVNTPDAGGVVTFPVSEQSTSGGVLTAINPSFEPQVLLSAAPGSGSLTVAPGVQYVGASGVSETFKYTAASGGMLNGGLSVVIPDGWSAPSTDPSEPGYVSSTAGSVHVDGQAIYIEQLSLGKNDSVLFTYGDNTKGGPGATVGTNGGSYGFYPSQASNVSQGGASLADNPQVDLVAPDGSGSMAVSPQHAGLGSGGNTLAFTYTPANGGLFDGTVTLTVPDGWSAPSTSASDPGFVEATDGQVSTQGSTITVSHLTLDQSSTLGITYGATDQGGPGANAPTSLPNNPVQQWKTQEASSPTGTLTSISAPTTALVAADGSGTMAISPAYVVQGAQTTETMTYTAATGGLDNGTVSVQVPNDWEAAQNSDPVSDGYVSATMAGNPVDENNIQISNNQIVVGGVSLQGGQKLVITYANAAAPSTGEQQTWNTSVATSQDTNGSEIANDASVAVVSADGSGSMQVDKPVAGVSKSGNTFIFTYTADTGGLFDGKITLQVPTGWSKPSLTDTAPGFTTASGGDVSVDANSGLITVSNVTLGDGDTLTITYGDQSQGGSGAKAPATTGDNTFTASEASEPGGTLTALATQAVVTVIGPPTVSGVTDANYNNQNIGLVGDPVTISGSGFMSNGNSVVTDVQFNGQSVSTFQVDDDNTIETNVPDGATTGDVTVITAGGTSATSAKDTFTVIQAPQIDSFSPDGAGAGATVTINGSGFTGVDIFGNPDHVQFGGGIDATSYSVVSDTKITAVVPTGATPGPIVVTNDAGTAQSSDNFIAQSVPTINSINPNVGGTGTIVSFTGTGYDDGTVEGETHADLTPVVTFPAAKANGKPVKSTDVEVQDDGDMTALVPSGAGTGPITVTNKAGSVTSTDTFTVVKPPTIKSIAPAIALPGATVTITGTSLSTVTEVDFGPNALAATVDNGDITVVNDTKITVNVPAGGTNQDDGPVTLYNAVFTPDTSVGVTSSQAFSFIVDPDPETFSVDHGKAGTIFTLQAGTGGFLGTTNVWFTSANGTGVKASKFKVLDDNDISVTVPASAITGPVYVQNPATDAEGDTGPPPGIATQDAFTIVSKPANIQFVDNANTPAIVGDDITITGTGFTWATKVTIGGATADWQYDPTNPSDTEIDTTVPPGAKTGKVTVTTAAGTGTSAATLQIVPPPLISSITPFQEAGHLVVIKGTNFSNVTEVDFGSAQVTNTASSPDGTDGYTVDNSKQITVGVPDGSDTNTPITVITSDHGYAVSLKPFWLQLPPDIDSLSVPFAKVGGSLKIYSAGDGNFFGATKVMFGSVPQTKFTVSADGSTITTTVPAKTPAGQLDVSVTNNLGDTSPTVDGDQLTVVVTPKITNFSPGSGLTESSVTITGSGFTGATTVKFGTTSADFTFTNDGSITATVPDGLSVGKTYKISVTNAAGSATSTAAFKLTGLGTAKRHTTHK